MSLAPIPAFGITASKPSSSRPRQNPSSIALSTAPDSVRFGASESERSELNQPKHEIIEQPNGVAPIVRFTLEPGQTLFAESGAMLTKDPHVDLDTNFSNKGFFSSVWRNIASGESIMKQKFTSPDKPGEVTIAAPIPGKVMAVDLNGNESLIVQDNSFLAYTGDIESSISFREGQNRPIRTGLLGGEGFLFQKYSGNGRVFLNASGNIMKVDLKEGQALDVDNGSLVAYTNGVNYDFTMNRGKSGTGFFKNLKNMALSGEGLFHARLTGPGTVYIQSMPFYKLASRIVTAGGGHSGGGGSGFSLIDLGLGDE